jgi:hypothetical protein
MKTDVAVAERSVDTHKRHQGSKINTMDTASTTVEVDMYSKTLLIVDDNECCSRSTAFIHIARDKLLF